jgi:tetratricopeptide (TPR) repeat protein
VVGLGAGCLGAVDQYLGRLALSMGRRNDAIDHLRRAVEANARLGAVVELAHARLDLARALGRGAEAAELIETAQRTAAERALAKVARRAEELRGG